MNQASQDFFTLLQCLRSTALPFAASSVVVTLVAISLTVLVEHPKFNRWIDPIIALHLGPLIIAPVLFANLLTTFVEARALERAQSIGLVAVFGFLFHTVLAYVVLTRVFDWKSRVERTQRLAFNSARTSSVNWVIRVLELGPPVAFTLAMVFVFQESMISVPLFTSRATMLSTARDIINSSTVWWYAFFVALCLLGIAVVFLILSYQIPRLAGIWMLSRLARRTSGGAALSNMHGVKSERGNAVVLGTALVIVATSTAIHLTVTVIVGVELVKLSGGGMLSETGPAWNSLVSPAVLVGLVIFGMWIVWRLIWTKRRLNANFRSLTSLALIPPSLLGTVGLVFVSGRWVQYFIAYGILSFYACFLFGFFISDSGLASDRLLLQNSRLVGLSTQRRLLVILLSALGSVLWPALWGFYFLWIEDGVQVTILSDTHTLASLVRGLKQDKLLPATYLGLLECFAVWFVLAVLVGIGTRWRHGILRPLIKRVVSAAILLFACGALVVGTVTATTNDQDLRKTCAEKQIVIHASEVFMPKCADDEIEEVIVEGMAGSINIILPNAEITIKQLTFVRGGATFHVVGKPEQDIREFKIDSIHLQGATAEVAQVEFENTKIGYLLVSGSTVGKQRSGISQQAAVNVSMKEGSSAQNVNVHDLNCPELTIQMAQKGMDSVHFEHVTSGGVKISAEQSEANTSIEGDLTLEKHAEQLPKISIERLMIRNLILSLDGPSGLDLEMTTLKTDPQAKANLQITAQQGVVNILVEDLTLASQFSISGSRSSGQIAQYRVTMYLIGRGVRFTNPSPGLTLSLPNLSRLVMKQIDLDQVSLCGTETRKEDDLQRSLDIEDLSVTGEASVTKGLMDMISTQNSSGISRLRLLKLLQDHGVFCEGKQPIGVQALYSRKRAELFAVNPAAGWIIDRMTGFGVQLSNMIWTFTFVIVLYFALRCFLLILDRKYQQTKPTFGPFISDLLIGGFLGSLADKHGPRMQKGLEILRLVFGWFVFVQITLCSIYLSQTTLQ